MKLTSIMTLLVISGITQFEESNSLAEDFQRSDFERSNAQEKRI